MDAGVGSQRELLTLLSHDLRQSLQSIQYLCETIAEQAPDTVSVISEIVTSIGGLLERVLLVCESDETELVSESCRLGDVLQTLRRELHPLAERKGLPLIVPDPSERISTDPILFRELLHNLLTNAIRYTAEGRVEVRCATEPGSTRIEIHDTGAGIERERLAALLRATTERHSLPNAGAGLGLAIAHKLAAALGLRLEIESIPGAGSCFAVVVPT